MSDPIINITDEGGCFLITIEHLGNKRIVATVPTGSQAAYPEAVARGRAEANVKANAHVESYRTMYSNLVVVDKRPEVIDQVHALASIQNDALRTTTARPVKLYDRLLNKTLIVLGTSASGSTLLVRYESETATECTVDAKTLRCSADFVAVCDHGYTANDSCPGCDYDADLIRARVEGYGTEVTVHAFGHMIDLGMIYNNADTTWSAITPAREILSSRIRTGDDAIRALTLDHKRRVWFTALNDNVLHDARKWDAYAAEYADTREDHAIRQAVRTLMGYGVTTAAQFVAHVLRLDGVLADVEDKILGPTPVRISDLVTGPADLWTINDSIKNVAEVSESYPDGMTFVDRTEYPVTLTAEQVIPVPIALVRQWMLGSPHVAPVSDPSQSQL